MNILHLIILSVGWAISLSIYWYIMKRRRLKETLGVYYYMTKEQRCKELELRIKEEGVGYTVID